MAFHLIASHIQHEREEEARRIRLERLVRSAARSPSMADRLRAAAGRRLIHLGQALGGDALRTRRPRRKMPAGRAAA